MNVVTLRWARLVPRLVTVFGLGSASEAWRDDALYKFTVTLLYVVQTIGLELCYKGTPMKAYNITKPTAEVKSENLEYRN